MGNVNFSCHDVISVDLGPVSVKRGFGDPYAVRTLRIKTTCGMLEVELFSCRVRPEHGDGSAKFLAVNGSLSSGELCDA